ncbi:hypothetical protein TGCAST_202375 [Toxoplasma gondii CAST]|uniref:Uncharacterized protein n=1 Tax=Toxoplasma gondii CAST TaxID=943122 RepID=A0A425I3H8_TOXGO|nr:hypothetical protein TGCAST_202375 [Toxoplasma gondii CAST]
MLSSPYRPSSSPSSSSSSASASLCSASGFTVGNTRLLSSSSAAWYSALPVRNLSCHRPLVFLRAARPLAPLHRMVPRVFAFSFFSWLGTYMARFPRRSVGHWPRPSIQSRVCKRAPDSVASNMSLRRLPSRNARKTHFRLPPRGPLSQALDLTGGDAQLVSPVSSLSYSSHSSSLTSAASSSLPCASPGTLFGSASAGTAQNSG